MNDLVTLFGLLVAFGGLFALLLLFVGIGAGTDADPRGDLSTRLAAKHARRAKAVSSGPYGGSGKPPASTP